MSNVKRWSKQLRRPSRKKYRRQGGTPQKKYRKIDETLLNTGCNAGRYTGAGAVTTKGAFFLFGYRRCPAISRPLWREETTDPPQNATFSTRPLLARLSPTNG